MTPPGDRLRSMAARVCEAATMERLIDPVIADLQGEHSEAIRRGQVWRSRRIRLAGYLGFWKAVSMQTGGSFMEAIGKWAVADNGALGRTVAFSFVAMAALILFQDLTGLQLGPRVEGHTGRLLVYLVAQSIPGAIVFGLPIGILCALRGRAATARVRRAILALAIGCAVTELGLMFW